MSARAKDILVAGLGNVFFGDDGFGVEVARRLHARGPRPGVRVVDFGIRGHDLALALSSGLEAAVLVDATARGGEPGTLYVLEPGEFGAIALDTHAMTPAKALELARAMGGLPKTLRVVACEAKTLATEEEPIMGLSPEVAAAVDRAVMLVDEIVDAVARKVRDA